MENAKNKGIVPFLADPGPTMWARLFGFSMKDYHTDLESFLEGYMRGMLALSEVGCDTTYYKEIPFFPGVPFESSLIGMQPMFADYMDPWVQMPGKF